MTAIAFISSWISSTCLVLALAMHCWAKMAHPDDADDARELRRNFAIGAAGCAAVALSAWVMR